MEISVWVEELKRKLMLLLLLILVVYLGSFQILKEMGSHRDNWKIKNLSSTKWITSILLLLNKILVDSMLIESLGAFQRLNFQPHARRTLTTGHLLNTIGIRPSTGCNILAKWQLEWAVQLMNGIDRFNTRANCSWSLIWVNLCKNFKAHL